MIQKKSIWFITLFTLILALSIYYVTMPSELLMTNNSVSTKNDKQKEEKVSKEVVSEIEESEILTSLRVEADEKVQKEIDKMKEIMSSSDATSEDRNVAYEKIKSLNENRGLEEKLEKQILDEFKLKSFVKIDGDQIKVVALSKSHDVKLANNIMRSLQKTQNKKMYISVQFQNS